MGKSWYSRYMAQHRHHKPKQAAVAFSAPTTASLARSADDSLVSASRKKIKEMATGIELRDAKRTFLFMIITLGVVILLTIADERFNLGMTIGEPMRNFLKLGS
jgi:hypothetical protein